MFVAAPGSALGAGGSDVAFESDDDAITSVVALEDVSNVTGEATDETNETDVNVSSVDDSVDELDTETSTRSTSDSDVEVDDDGSNVSVNETSSDVNETLNETDGVTNETLDGAGDVVDDTELTIANGTDVDDLQLEPVLATVEDPGALLEATDPVVDGERRDGTSDGESESDEGTVSNGSMVDGPSERHDRNEATADEESDDGGSIPGEKAGAGLAIGAGITGLGLLARRFGTAAMLSASQGGGGSLPSSIATAIRVWGFRVLAILGYRRFSDDDPLEHEARSRMYEYIASSPGSYLSEISEETDVPLQSARYHLRILEFENLIDSEKIGGRRRYVPIGTDSPELEAALNDEATAAVVHALADEEPVSVSGLAEALDRDPSTVSHHLSRLEEAGLVERERDGRGVVNRLPEDVRRALADRRGDAVAIEPTGAGGVRVPESGD